MSENTQKANSEQLKLIPKIEKYTEIQTINKIRTCNT